LYVAESPQKPGNPGAMLTIAHAAREDAVLSSSLAIDWGQPAHGARGLASQWVTPQEERPDRSRRGADEVRSTESADAQPVEEEG
jgi:hypothetical protein